MNYILNNENRNLEDIRTMNVRKIQEEAISRIQCTISNKGKLVVNMPCRSGKTFTTLYSAYKSGVEFVIVLCAKASAKSSYNTDSVWKNGRGEVEGFDIVVTQNAQIKNFLTKDIPNNKKILIEITPQMLNKNPNLLLKLREITANRNTLLVFDEAHFAEQTEKTQAQISNIVGEWSDSVSFNEITNVFDGTIPYIYLTASPDTQSLQKKIDDHIFEYYELDKETECALYLQDLEKVKEEREFDYVPVRNAIYIDNKILDSVFNGNKSQAEDYSSLFTLPLAVQSAKNFVKKALENSIEIILHNELRNFDNSEYQVRGQNINLMIKLPKNRKKQNAHIGEKVEGLIRKVESYLLEKYPQYTSVEILDVTDTNNYSQDQANEFLNSHKNSINIILTKKRLIEGTTLHNLDAFLYWANQNSLAAMKQECGRTLTPVLNKTFGFIFFYDECGLSLVRMLLRQKAKKANKENKGPRRLTTEQKHNLTRINPTFLASDQGFKLLTYDEAIDTKTLLERARVRETIFDRDILLNNLELKSLLSKFFGVMDSFSKTKKKDVAKTMDECFDEGRRLAQGKGSTKEISVDTPNDEVKLEKLVTTLMYIFQSCVDDNISIQEGMSEELRLACVMNDFPDRALSMMLENESLKDSLLDIYEVVENDYKNKNPELFDEVVDE